jgi:MFS transporter, putative metabolite transport protein
MFLIDIIAFVVLGLAQAFVTDVQQLFVVRVLLGVAIGAEYAIGPPMLSEFAEPDVRGRRGAAIQVCWYVGFVLSVAAGYLLLDSLDASWRVILATSAVPAVITLIMRHGLPESPRWLVSVGRTEEAKAVVERHFGSVAHFEREFAGEAEARGSVRQLLSPAYRTRTLMICALWACLIAPYFAIVTFAPDVFGALALDEERVGTIATNVLGVLGAFAGLLVIERVSRRRMLIAPLWVCAAALVVVGVWPEAPVGAIIACFVTFAFFNALAADLCTVYPNELFPTHLRTTGVGVAAAASRIGAAIGTFLLPIGLDTIGVGPSMLVGAAFCAVGALVCHRWAPETAGRPLEEAARGGSGTLRAAPAEAG